MLGKVFDFLGRIAMNGFVAIFVALIFNIILAMVFVFVMIPVSIIISDEVARNITDFFAGNNFGYKIVYTVVFISMVMEDLGVLNDKTMSKRWRKRKKHLSL